MNHTMTHASTAPLLRRSELPEKSGKPAKAVLPNSEKELTWMDLAWCLEQVRYDARMNHDEFARALKRDPSQVRRMLEAKERPQIEAVWPDERLRRLLIIAMAKRGGGFDVKTTLIVGVA